MISVSIVCFNEDKKIEDCLISLSGFADEIVVVDLGSTDGTEKIAQKFGAKIFHNEFVPFVELVRNYAISKTTGDWILILDPDERVTDSLKNKLKQVIQEDQFVAVNIPRKNIFFNKWISHSNWWPDKHVRFFKKGKVRWTSEIHVYPKVDGNTLELPAKEELAIVHFGYNSVKDFIDRQSRYSEVEAQNLFDQGIRFSWFNFFWKPFREFLVRFVKHLGFMDGFLGFSLTYLMMIYQIEVQIKLWEMENKK